MEFLAQYSLFLLKAFTLVIAMLILFAGILALGRKPKPKLTVVSLNEEFDEVKAIMQKEISGKKVKKNKVDKKMVKPNLYVLDFKGDIKASQVDQLRDEISAILLVAKKSDEVVVRLESPGGMVSGYGLAASQLQRIRDKDISLTVCIDKVAASGGYLMACVANHIVAAPFATIGSIGVVAQFPNFHRWLKKNNIDVELLTAGEYKRTMTLFTENTQKGREKFQKELETVHQFFREYLVTNRQQLDIEKIATGEHWLAKDALTLQLVDALGTSDDYLMNKIETFHTFKVSIPTKQSFANKFLKMSLASFMRKTSYYL